MPRRAAAACFSPIRRRSPFSPLAALLGAVLLLPACASGHGAAGAAFEPAHPDTLTVATAFLPAPGFWVGHSTKGGFEANLARALADELGLARVRVVQVPFAQIVSGHLHGADLALSQLTPTKKREHVLDFTTPYVTAPPGILARTGVAAADEQDLRALRWVVSTTSTLTPIVRDRVRPEHAPLETEDRTQALAALRAGRAESLMLDLPVAQGLARTQPATFQVLGQLSGGEGLAVALPNDSPNLEIVDSTIRRLQADGTIDRLVKRWLGKTADDVPLILTQQ